MRYGKDGRRAPREPHDSALELLDDEGRLLSGAHRLIDVSAAGLSFSTVRVFRKGAQIRGRIRIYERGVFEFEGRVVRLKERFNSNLYGVAFDSVKGRLPPAPDLRAQ